MELVARTPHGQLTLELTHVLYVKGFLTSVLGLARYQTESIHFDSGRDILYMHQPLTSSRNSNTMEDTGCLILNCHANRRYCFSTHR
jgi:hypothetical protein